MLRRTLIAIAFVLAGVLAAGTGVVATSIPVRGTSMEPTMIEGDRLLRSPFGTDPTVTRFAIVVARFGPNGADIVKRVIALPGDRIEISKPGARVGVVRVQPGGTGPWYEVDNPAWEGQWGTLASNCCTDSGKATNLATPQVVPPGKLFLLGDNLQRSDDSRTHGWATESLVAQTLTWRVYPLNRIGRFDANVRLIPAG